MSEQLGSISEQSVDQKYGKTLLLSSESQDRINTILVAKALGSSRRLRILDYLQKEVAANMSQLSKALDIPLATASQHLNVLEKAQLVQSRTSPGLRGQQRIYTLICDTVIFQLPHSEPHKRGKEVSIHMPIGSYVKHEVTPTCGLASSEQVIGLLDDPISFYEPGRLSAQLIWLSEGYLEYHFPNRNYKKVAARSLQLSVELCSEAASAKKVWPSDIYLEINGVRIGSWTSPGDFNDRRGRLTPSWWPDISTQYGLLKVWRADETASYIDGERLSDVTIRDLGLEDKSYITVRIGVDSAAAYVGGINLFGHGFGNHAQDMVLQILY